MPDIIHIELDSANLLPPTPEVEQERKVALFDLLEDNSFALLPRDTQYQGPYKVLLAIRERRLVFTMMAPDDDPVGELHLSLGPFRQVIKDYFQICKSYFDAVKTQTPAQIETIDMARRGIHNEGARVLQERIEGKIEVDHDTARRLFTLISVLHFGG